MKFIPPPFEMNDRARERNVIPSPRLYQKVRDNSLILGIKGVNSPLSKHLILVPIDGLNLPLVLRN